MPSRTRTVIFVNLILYSAGYSIRGPQFNVKETNNLPKFIVPDWSISSTTARESEKTLPGDRCDKYLFWVREATRGIQASMYKGGDVELRKLALCET